MHPVDESKAHDDGSLSLGTTDKLVNSKNELFSYLVCLNGCIVLVGLDPIESFLFFSNSFW